MADWGKRQSNLALSGRAGLIACGSGISETKVGGRVAHRGVRPLPPCVDASARNGMLRRTGAGRFNISAPNNCGYRSRYGPMLSLYDRCEEVPTAERTSWLIA